MRYRLIPTLGTGHPDTWVETESERELREFAEAFSGDLGIPVSVVQHPKGGLVTRLFTVGGDPNERKVRRVR